MSSVWMSLRALAVFWCATVGAIMVFSSFVLVPGLVLAVFHVLIEPFAFFNSRVGDLSVKF